MAPSSQKRKRKPLPKRPCPCCGSLLSEKTIERHASGTHVPTRINVTLAAAAKKRAKVDHSSDVFGFGDLYDDSSAIESSDLEQSVETASGMDHTPDDEAWNAADEDHGFVEPDVEGGRLEEIVRDTWSRCRSRLDDYESDDVDEEEGFEGNADASDPDSDIELEGVGECNGLGMNDLVEEDIQRIIAEFSALFPASFESV
jgi:hypothetical protein